MRVQWALAVIVVMALTVSALPASACIADGPAQEFEAQAVSAGTAFPDLTLLSSTTVEEMFPQATTFKDQLFVVWQKENFTDTVKYFATLRAFDGKEWTDPVYPSCPDPQVPQRSELNLNPRLGSDDRALYVAWSSNEPNWTTGVDDDIVFRYTEDGTTWSEVIEVSGHYNDGLDKLPVVQSMDGTVWFLWETNDRVDSDGADMDIVMRPWNGKDFGQTIEVTPPGDTYNDFNVQVASDGQRMYMIWMTANYSSGMGNVNDIWGRVFDGTSWVTPPMKLDSDALADNEHPTVVAADDRAFFVWETQDTGKVSDLSSVVMREWSPEEGLGYRMVISSLTSNGKDSKPTGLWYHDQLFIAWITSDPGISFGEDTDLVYRVGQEDRYGQIRFGDFEEVSSSTDDYLDRFPALVVYDDIVNVVWVVDTNYTEYMRQTDPDLLYQLGGVFHSPDVCIQSIYIPFEKQLGLVYTLGTAFPTATRATSAKITVTGLGGEPLDGLSVTLRAEPKGGPSWKRVLVDLSTKGGGVYSSGDLVFPMEGTYEVRIIIQGVEAGTFSVDVVPPPPSFIDRVPTTAVFFVAAGAVMGVVLFRRMGKDELVDEIRPAPLTAFPEESY